jgi:hypothetical protein
MSKPSQIWVPQIRLGPQQWPNFVMEDSLGGGVTRSLAMDAHGKSLSFALLNLEMPEKQD